MYSTSRRHIEFNHHSNPTTNLSPEAQKPSSLWQPPSHKHKAVQCSDAALHLHRLIQTFIHLQAISSQQAFEASASEVQYG